MDLASDSVYTRAWWTKVLGRGHNLLFCGAEISAILCLRPVDLLAVFLELGLEICRASIELPFSSQPP